MISVLAGVGALMAVGFIWFYKLDEGMMEQIGEDLTSRRAGNDGNDGNDV